MVTNLADGAQAAGLGILPGDIILRVNNSKVTSVAGFRAHWSTLTPQQEGSLTLLRAETEFEVRPKAGRVGGWMFDLPAASRDGDTER